MKKLFILITMVLVTAISYSQDKSQEVNSEVKELNAFHKVIYKIWHKGWPDKDIGLLKSLLPEVETGIKNINAAELPGILRDKTERWNEGLKTLNASLDKYKTSCGTEDTTAILSAAEALHSNFEGMVRIIKPVIKEVDEFHKELYMLFHYYMPENDVEKIKSSAVVLNARMKELNEASLPDRLSSKKESFDKARLELTQAVDGLNTSTAEGKNIEEIKKAVNSVHSKYQELEKIFD